MTMQNRRFQIPKELYEHISTTYDLKLLNQVGFGLTSHIYKAVKSDNESKLYAVKVFDFSICNGSANNERLKLQYQIEANTLQLFKAEDGIVQVYYHGVFQHYGYIVMEYIDGYSLRDFANMMINAPQTKNKQSKNKEKEDQFLEHLENVTEFKQKIVILVAQLVLILQKFQAYGIIHRDLKLENIMVDHNYKLKMIDFGSIQLSPNITKKEQSQNNKQWEQIIKLDQQLNSKNDYIVGSKHYICPELISGKRNRIISNKIDIWSLGIIVYRILCNKYPFEDSGNNLFKKIRSEQPDFCDSLLESETQFIKRCLKKNPEQRPSSKQLKQLKYFSQVNWKQDDLSKCLDFCENQLQKEKNILQLNNKNIIYICRKAAENQEPIPTVQNLSDYQIESSQPQVENILKTGCSTKLKKYRNVRIKIVQQGESKRLYIMLGGGRACKSNLQDLKISQINDYQAKFENRKSNKIFHLKFVQPSQLQQFLCFLMENRMNSQMEKKANEITN